MAISDWPAEERPRERLFSRGAGALSDAELIALFLRTGTRGRNAVDLARELLAQSGGLGGLLNGGTNLRIRGLGPAKCAQLAAVLEVARRCLGAQLQSASALDSPQAVRDYLRLAIAPKEHEVFLCLWLDSRHRVLSCEEAFRGTLGQTAVYPREIVKSALRANAAAVIFAHNHPSGVAQPSQADELLTRSLRDALALIDVRVLDHFVVAGSQCLSFAERGLL